MLLLTVSFPSFDGLSTLFSFTFGILICYLCRQNKVVIVISPVIFAIHGPCQDLEKLFNRMNLEYY